MATEDPTAPPRRHVVAAAALLTACVTALLTMHVASRRYATRDALSSYAAGDGGWLFGVSVLLLAACSVPLVRALQSAGAHLRRTTVFAFGGWSVALVAAALYPAAYTPDADPLSGTVHLYAAGSAFIGIPLSVTLVLRDTAGSLHLHRARRRLARCLVAAVGALGLFGLSYLVGKVSTASELGAAAVAVTQRVALGADLLLFLALLRLAASWSSIWGGQLMQSSLPSGSAMVTHVCTGPCCPRCRTVAPDPTSRSTSVSTFSGPTRRSRWTRFFTVLASGTSWNRIRRSPSSPDSSG